MRRERNTKRKRGSGENRPRVSKISTPEKKTNQRKLADKKESAGTRRRKRPQKKEADISTRRRQRAEKKDNDRNTTRRRRPEKSDKNRNTTRHRRQEVHTSRANNHLMMIGLSVVVVAVIALGLQFAFSSQRNVVRLKDRDNQNTPQIAENNVTSEQQQSSTPSNDTPNNDTSNNDTPPQIPQKSFYDNPNRNTQKNPVPYIPPRIQPQEQQIATVPI